MAELLKWSEDAPAVPSQFLVQHGHCPGLKMEQKWVFLALIVHSGNAQC